MNRLGLKTHLQATLFFISLMVLADAFGTVNDIIKCSSDIIYNRQGGVGTLTNLSGLLESSINSETNSALVESNTTLCHLLAQSTQSFQTLPEVTYLSQIAALRVDDGIKNLFMGFAKPTYNCHSLGGHMGGSFVVFGINSSLDLAFCESSLGNSWIEFRPSGELEFGPGIGVSGGFQAGWDNDLSYSSSPVSLSPKISFTLTSLIGVRAATRGFRGFNTAGLDYMVGTPKLAMGIGAQISILALPLGTNYDKLRMNILKYRY